MRREAILVLGMHRGGTSATAGLLVRLGAQPPATLMPADVSNPEGYWESRLFWEIHERLLRDAGSRWDSYTRLDTDRLSPSDMANLSAECRLALHSEFGDVSRFILKDPRMCRFVPFWLQILNGEGIAPAAVLVLRSPLAIARSLAARNEFETGLSLLIWLRHVLDAEFHTRSVRRTFVHYRDLIEGWKVVAGRVSRDLGISWSPRTLAADVEIDRFVQSGLCHHPDGLDSPELAPLLAEWLSRTLAALQRLHDHGPLDAGACTELDAIRLEFDRATSVFGDVGDRLRGKLQSHIDDIEQEVHRLREQAASLEALRSSLQKRVVDIEQHSEALQSHVQTLQQALTAAHQDANALRESISWRITAPLRAVYRLFR